MLVECIIRTLNPPYAANLFFESIKADCESVVTTLVSYQGVVKWYHAWFGTMWRKFDSFYPDQVLLCIRFCVMAHYWELDPLLHNFLLSLRNVNLADGLVWN